MKIYLYQDNREPYFWTKDELLQLEDNNQFLLSEIDSFNIGNVEFNIRKPKTTDFQIDGLNVLILNYTRDISVFKNIFDLNRDKRFLLVIKTNEDYAHVRENQHEEFIEYIVNSNNIKVIWDISEVNYKNFYFEPKVHLQNYYNIDEYFPSDLFLYGKDFWLNQSNKKRVGVHFNKGNLILRKSIIERLKDYNNENLFLTINSNCIDNKINNVHTNYISQVYDNSFNKHGFPYKKYIDSFINLNIKSEMEVVYETFTSTANHLNLLKLNEKTIKHLYLGKPFIHADPIAYNLLINNGLQPCVSLYKKELFEFYNGIDTHQLFKDSSPFWVDKLVDNVKWLAEMDSIEWQNRIMEAYEISQTNKEIVETLIFNKSLISYVINYDVL